METRRDIWRWRKGLCRMREGERSFGRILVLRKKSFFFYKWFFMRFFAGKTQRNCWTLEAHLLVYLRMTGKGFIYLFSRRSIYVCPSFLCFSSFFGRKVKKCGKNIIQKDKFRFSVFELVLLAFLPEIRLTLRFCVLFLFAFRIIVSYWNSYSSSLQRKT